MNSTNEEKLRINKKMIGQTVYVLEKSQYNWYGEVKDAIDHETFLIKNQKSEEEREVNIFDIRSRA